MLLNHVRLFLAVLLIFLFRKQGVAQTVPVFQKGHGGSDSKVSSSIEKLGSVHFPISCTTKSQADFERGVALLHSFGYVEAEQQFREISNSDPMCAMAHWGIAMSHFHELWERPDSTELKTGTQEMLAAESVVSRTTVTIQEKDYIEALNGFYIKAPGNFQAAVDRYADAMGALHAQFPFDVEIGAFYALSVLASEAPDDTSLNKERTALAVLMPLFRQYPRHPGLAHYIIHTCDTPALASYGLEAAKVYAGIAPSSPHALHMPSHIFARLGMWQDDIRSNLASVAASKRAEDAGLPGVAHQLHADEFLVYAYLQIGNDEKASALIASMPIISKHIDAMPGMDDMKGSGGLLIGKLNVIDLMETHQWEKLASPVLNPGLRGPEKLYAYWGQGVGAGHLHDAKGSADALATINQLLDAQKRNRYHSIPTSMLIKRDEALGWQSFAKGDDDAAIIAMRHAADQQDLLGQDEVDISAREMLGDLLVIENKPQAALDEYKIALKLSPNRLNGLLGAAKAAEEAGLLRDALGFYSEAAHNAHGEAESKRPELIHALQFVEQHRQ